MNHQEPGTEPNQEALRNEIIESQKTQADFLKWKLIAVGAIASLSLGLTEKVSTTVDTTGLQLLLCAVPMVCAYTDFISLHIMIRIVTIGSYLRHAGSKYEDFVFRTREKKVNPFIFETMALHGSSVVFNAMLLALSATNLTSGWVSRLYIISGTIGILVTLGALVLYTKRAKQVADLIKVDQQDEVKR